MNYLDFDTEFKEEYFYDEVLTVTTKRKKFKQEQEYRMMLFKIDSNSVPFKDLRVDFMNQPKAHELVKERFVPKLYDMPEKGVP